MSDFTVNTYSPDDIVLIISGYKVSGWDRITITRNNPGFTPFKGIRGKDSRDKNESTAATLSLSVLSTCPVNSVLSAVHKQDLIYGTGRLIITLKDNSGMSLFGSNEAYILAYPTAGFGADSEYRVWNIQCQTTTEWTVGGNTRPTTKLLDNITNYITDLF